MHVQNFVVAWYVRELSKQGVAAIYNLTEFLGAVAYSITDAPMLL